MSDTTPLNSVHRAVLTRVDRGRRDFIIALCFVAGTELAGLIGFLLLMDFDERLHWLLLVMAFLIYGTLAVGLIALGAYIRCWLLRLLKAIELMEDRSLDPQ
jgi:hypothetical protein